MKYILAFLLLSSCYVFAAKFHPVGKDGAKTNYVKQEVCEQLEGQDCYDITDKDPRYYEAKTVEVDDTEKPIFKPAYNATTCSDDADCLTKRETMNCNEGDFIKQENNIFPIPGDNLSCTGIASYEKKNVIQLVENADLKASVLASDQAADNSAALLDAVLKNMAFGKRMIGYIGAMNVQKGLNAAQIKSMVTTYSEVNTLLLAGAVETAKAEIEALTPDGTIITQADKTAILGEFTAYLGQ